MKFERKEFVTLENGVLWRNFVAGNKLGELLVGRRNEDGLQMSRNIDYAGMFGWRFVYPGQKVNVYGSTYFAQLDEWSDYTPSLENFCWDVPNEKDKAVILSKYPGLQWILKKADYSVSQIFRMIPLWKKHGRLCETLVSMGLHGLALNGSLYTSHDPWSIVKWMSRHKDCHGCSLVDIRLMMKYGVDYDTVNTYRATVHKWNYVTFDEWRYLFDKEQGPSYYNDYRRMCLKAGHDFKDPYWHFPRDLKKQHDKVMKECEAIDMAEEAMRRAERRKAEKERKQKLADHYEKFVKMMGKWCEKVSGEKDGIFVFVPQDVKSVKTQSTKLHQCLMACDYISKVVEKKCLLVFIYKNGRPYATAELKPSGRKYQLGQFYGNERNADCNARQDAREALEQWARINNIKIVA